MVNDPAAWEKFKEEYNIPEDLEYARIWKPYPSMDDRWPTIVGQDRWDLVMNFRKFLVVVAEIYLSHSGRGQASIYGARAQAQPQTGGMPTRRGQDRLAPRRAF